ncbi:MAG: hypothetical protein ACD_79C00721G0004 [uncultured bacterium]|nr:MAG: hypothetical protein ACD_79C00721G0004 [uncultured bacterium]
MKYRKLVLNPPSKDRRVLLHVCCAPCSCAIIDTLIESDVKPTLFFYNPNICTEKEYLRRKNEVLRFAESRKVPVLDVEYAHDDFLSKIKGLEEEPEGGKRCSVCFDIRLKTTAHYAFAHNYLLFATTLGISRFKNIEEINRIGREATELYPFLTFWDYNWKQGGFPERMREISDAEDFYMQKFCGCEYARDDKLAQSVL